MDDKGLDRFARDLEAFSPQTQPDAEASDAASANEHATADAWKVDESDGLFWLWRDSSLGYERHQNGNGYVSTFTSRSDAQRYADLLNA